MEAETVSAASTALAIYFSVALEAGDRSTSAGTAGAWRSVCVTNL